MTGRLPCPGPSRREFLRVGALSAFGLGLADWFRAGSARANPAGYETVAVPATAKGCILIWLAGGMSHIDTFDPKPDAPADIKGEFKAIDTAVPGIKLSEVFPKLAATMDRFAVIRSMTSPEAEHDRAAHHLLTGYRPSPALVYPSYGSVISKVQADVASLLPRYVAMPDAPLFSSSGYLTPAYDPFAVGGDPNGPGFKVRDLTPPDRLTLDRLNRRRGMVRDLDRFSGGLGQTPLTTSRDKFAEQAYDLLTSSQAQQAFRIDREPEAVRERYGRNPLGQSCLLARRLIESGVGFVTINDRGGQALQWDTHAQNFAAIKNTLAPPLDQGISTLLRDLEERGMLETTLVLVMGEFGRTPKVNQNAGRDHHGRANSVLVAGAGVPGGLALGRTDAKADSPAERPITPADLAATVYQKLGVSPEARFSTPDGQPIRLVDKGEVIREIG